MEKRGGEYGWLAIGAFVAAYDLLAPETLTAAFKRAQLAVRVGSLAITGAHLMGVLPRRIDPFYKFLELPGIRGLNIDKGPTIDDGVGLGFGTPDVL